jgi:hypothetical protein
MPGRTGRGTSWLGAGAPGTRMDSPAGAQAPPSETTQPGAIYLPVSSYRAWFLRNAWPPWSGHVLAWTRRAAEKKIMAPQMH